MACSSPPTSRLTSVDLPTPDPPRSAAVTPCRICAWTSSKPDPRDRTLDDDVDAGGDILGEFALVVDVLGDVGLGQNDDRLGAGLPRQHEFALEAADVDALAGERLHDEDDVGVGDEHLLVGLLAGVLAHERARARQDGLDDRLVVALGDGRARPSRPRRRATRCRES